MAEEDLARHLEDDLFRLRRAFGEDRFPKAAKVYLTDWADDKSGWLRKRYIAGTDEAQFDLSPSTEAALSFLASLVGRSFIGTESRLRTVFDLLRSLINDTETDVGVRKAELLRRRAEIDAEIGRLDAGHVPILDDAIVRDRFHLIVETAQSLLGDFRAVEENFRTLDRDARIKIATWDGTKGELLERIFGDRDAIAESDQGRSFKAFYDLLMSTDRQDEFTRLLERSLVLDAVRRVKPDKRIRRVHYDWLTAAETTQGTVAKLSAELRRYLDDKAWLENRRIMSLLRDIEARAHTVADDPRVQGAVGEAFMELDAMAPDITLAMDRPLYSPPHRPVIAHTNARLAREHVPADALFDLVHVDRPRLEGHIRHALQQHDQVTLTRDIDAAVEAADDYRKKLRQLTDEGLPKFEARFKQLLNENAIREVAGFQSKLREEERTIKERIEIINESLHTIDYQDGTYIALEAAPTLDIEIREFQQDLRKCTENALTGSEDEAYAEAKFLEVSKVIQRLRGRPGLTDLDRRWTLKVTDVRNWFEFSASERWRADDVEREHYSDSGGKSGGQK